MKRIVTIFLLLAGTLTLRAQVASVEVSRAYDVGLDGILKPAIPVSVDDSLHRFDVRFDYSIFNRPYADLYDFTPYESIQLTTVGANRTPFLFARLGSRYAFGDRGLMPAAELYLQTKPKNGFCSGLYGRHNSFYGDLGRGFDEDLVLNTSRMENTVGGDLTYDWTTGELMFDVKYAFDRYRYTPMWSDTPSAGSSPFPTAAHLNNSLTASINLNSAQKEQNKVYYDVTLSYRNTRKDLAMSWNGAYSDTSRISEGFLQLNGYVGASFDIHRIYVDMNIEYASYGGMHDFQIGVVEFSPIYKFQRKRLDAKLGVKFGTRYGIAGAIEEPDLDLTARSSVFPDVDIRYNLIDKALWAHATVTGGNDLNPFSRMVDDCPIVLPSASMMFGRRPVDATLSLEGVFRGRLGVNLEGNFKMTRNKMILIPVHEGTELTQMTPSYRDVNQFSVQGEVFWRSQDLALGGRLRYVHYFNPEDKSKVTELPAWTAYGFVRYNFRERIIAQMECNYRSATSGNMAIHLDTIVPYSPVSYSVPAIVDLDLNINYLINKNFSVFVKAANILNHRNQYMPLYLEPGFNLGAGICVNF